MVPSTASSGYPASYSLIKIVSDTVSLPMTGVTESEYLDQLELVLEILLKIVTSSFDVFPEATKYMYLANVWRTHQTQGAIATAGMIGSIC
ncbi:hypothetical protein Tco_0209068 [Tanacetum coccineum]